MPNSNPSPSHIASLVIKTLMRRGVRHFFIAPGNRSTPLVEAITHEPLAQTTVCCDERSLAFMALGFSKATGEMPALILTSGSALGNTMPAVMEACHEKVGLLILSADRPFELQNVGANQTTHQHHFFAPFAKKSLSLPAFTPHTPLASITTALDQLISTKQNFVSHLNLHFQKPFFKEEEVVTAPHELTTYEGSTLIKHEVLSHLFERALSFEQGLILVGQTEHDLELTPLLKLSKALGWPLLIDPLSPLAKYQQSHDIISHFDLIFSQEKDLSSLHVEGVLQLGSRFISASLDSFIKASKPLLYAQLSLTYDSGDLNHAMTHRYIGSVKPALNALSEIATASPLPSKHHYLEAFKTLDSQAGQALDALCANITGPTLTQFFRKLKTTAPLFIGNSLAIRAASLAFNRPRELTHLFGRRGLSGIDGNLATCIGLSKGLEKPLLAIVGDQTFMHDVGSLQLLKHHPHPLTIVVLNNGGGQIFASLPIPVNEEVREQFWVNAENHDYEKIAAAFGLQYKQMVQLEAIELEAQHTLIEVVIEAKLCEKERQALKNLKGISPSKKALSC